MNPLLLWIPGTVLMLLAVLLLALDRIGLWPAIAIIGAGASLESVGAWLWLRQRKNNTAR